MRWILVAMVAGVLSSSVNGAPIEVRVEVTEVDHTKAAQMGVEWGNEAAFVEAVPRDAVQIGRIDRVTPLQAKLRFLVEEGAAELLANPNLVADSGTTASFQAGGEIPYVTSTSLGSTHVEFKPYGVFLKIKPKVLPDGRIAMEVEASVSAPDRTNGVFLSGNAVPALAERQVSSHVTVEPGTTLALAGLVQTQKDERISGVPVLRKLPLLGALFRWKQSTHRRTSVVVFMTPQMKEL